MCGGAQAVCGGHPAGCLRLLHGWLCSPTVVGGGVEGCVCVCGGGGGIKWQVAFTDIAFPPIKTILPLAVEAKAIACIRSLDREWESHALTYNGLCL